jgi:hypothetical protein
MMTGKMLKDHVWLAEARIAEGESNIARQRVLIAELEASGHSTLSAKDLLAEMESGNRLHQADRDRFRKELAERK